MSNDTLRAKLSSVLIQYDVKESAKPGYNRYALALYCEALQSAWEYVEQGKDIRAVLCGHFTGRLLSKLLKAADCSPMVKADVYGSPIRRTAY